MEMLRALPSLVDIKIPDGKHFTVCGDVHGQVVIFTLIGKGAYHFFLLHKTFSSCLGCASIE